MVRKKKNKKHINFNSKEQNKRIIVTDLRFNRPSRTENNDLLLNEYNMIAGRITDLSLKFSSGSYILPLSVIAALTSMSFESSFLSIIIIILPVILSLYAYNHIRYMALQFKLSGYQRHLEEKLNESVKCTALLWENTVAQGNKQGGFETVFMAFTYLIIAILIYCLSYSKLGAMSFADEISGIMVVAVTAVYHCLIHSLCYFLVFFTNVHDLSYKIAREASDKRRHDKNTKYISGRTYFFRVSLIFVFILSFPISLYPIIHYTGNTASDIFEQYDTIIVLGNKSENSAPSTDMQSRLDCLISILDDCNGKTIILSGGNGEAELMEDYLIRQGYAYLNVILEGDSKNTYQNFVNTKPLASNGAIVITSDYHIFRSKFICKELKMDCSFLPAKTEDVKFAKLVKECYTVYFELFRRFVIYFAK